MSFAQRINQSSWFGWADKKMDAMYLISTRKFKVLKRFVCGEGKMMKEFRAAEAAYYAGEFDRLKAIRNEIIYCPSTWIPHVYKQKDLMAYIAFLLGVRGWNQFQRGRMLAELRSAVDVRHELGRRILESATEVARSSSFHHSRSLVQPHQQR
jgi:hypothetical protein